MRHRGIDLPGILRRGGHVPLFHALEHKKQTTRRRQAHREHRQLPNENILQRILQRSLKNVPQCPVSFLRVQRVRRWESLGTRLPMANEPIVLPRTSKENLFSPVAVVNVRCSVEKVVADLSSSKSNSPVTLHGCGRNVYRIFSNKRPLRVRYLK